MDDENDIRLPQVGRRDVVPMQDRWVGRAERVRGPVSGFWFRFQATANTRALLVEKERVVAARGVVQEYAALFSKMRAALEAATTVHVRRELTAEFFAEELAQQQDAIEEARHRRSIAAKRRKKEAIEAETRQIEARHEQEAVERFKEEKLQVGMARFKAKLKEHLVGVASAEAAIAETKTADALSDKATNENEEVAALHGLLQRTQEAIEEGERLGKDTQPLRERLETYESLLNLVQGRRSEGAA